MHGKLADILYLGIWCDLCEKTLRWNRGGSSHSSHESREALSPEKIQKNIISTFGYHSG